jgi:FkbM family methyltransferase
MKAGLANNLYKLIRLYTFYSPIKKGKYRLYQIVMNSLGHLPENSVIAARDGRKFAARMETRMYDMVYFFGEYEDYVTEVIETLTLEGDISFDVGANFGWFSTLLLNAEKKGKKIKELHAFEPIPAVFENLCENLALAGSPANAFPNNLALTDEITETKIYTVDRLGTGHTSLVKKADEKITETPIRTTTLDAYQSEKKHRTGGFYKGRHRGLGVEIFARGQPDLQTGKAARDGHGDGARHDAPVRISARRSHKIHRRAGRIRVLRARRGKQMPAADRRLCRRRHRSKRPVFSGERGKGKTERLKDR